MLVSWNWLKDYVDLGMSVEDLTSRLTMSGLNLEEYNPHGDDWVIDLEVTSNRPDCLGHVGIAREVAVLYDQPLKLPSATPTTSSKPIHDSVSVAIDCPELCSQYHARLIRGVKIGPSPAWLQQRLQAVGIACVNNVVDITNYVMLEYGQPLHAFDFDALTSGAIVVRRAKKGEVFTAINQRKYELSADMCVVTDGRVPVAIAGIMGGLDSEIQSRTTNVLIEGAAFAPLGVRNTARRLDLHSPSSYRFERALDPLGPELASRRCCELILQLAGGELLDGIASAGASSDTQSLPEITLRFARFRKVLGIDIPPDVAINILTKLGLTVVSGPTSEQVTMRGVSFRRDLAREIDLIEEVARIHGYDKLPADTQVPLCTSRPTNRERLVDRVGETLTALGFFEAMTPAFLSPADLSAFHPEPQRPVLTVEHSTRRQENVLRPTLVPSLLASRRANERHGNLRASLFEIAKVYLAGNPSLDEATAEPWRIGFVTPDSYLDLKGTLETLAQRVNPELVLTVEPSEIAQFTPGRGATLLLDGQPWGWLGELDHSSCERAELREQVAVAEVDLQLLEEHLRLVPRVAKLPDHPAITRDLNFVLDDAVNWTSVTDVVRQSAGPLLERVEFGGQFRGKQLGEGKKSYVVSLTFRATDRTLTGSEVDTAQEQIIAACTTHLGAALRGA